MEYLHHTGFLMLDFKVFIWYAYKGFKFPAI